MATREEARQAREAKLDELQEKLTSAVEQLVTGEDWTRALTFAAQFRSRSFGNSLLIWAQHLEAYEQGRVPSPTPTLVAGYRDWEKLGRFPEAGGGYRIRSPYKARFASATPDDPMSWRRLAKGEKPKAGEAVQRRMAGVVPAFVWDVSRTHAAPVPELPSPKLLTGEAPAGLREGLIAQIEDQGFEVLPVAGASEIYGANGLTDYDARQVLYRGDMDPAAQVKTIAHELGHVRMHGPTQPEARRHRGIGEVEAESVALMVAAAHGMDTTDYTIPYVAGWAANVDGKNPVEVVQATARSLAAAGVPVFPCAPGGKSPLLREGPGFHDATTDLGRVESWWRQSPAANIAVPTGRASGVSVVDIDVHGVDGFTAFRRARRAGLVTGWEAMVRSPTGGLHVYYPAADTEQPSWQAGKAGVDFRGDRGYIVIPPSRRQIDGDSLLYRLASVSPAQTGAVDAQELRNFLSPPPAPRPPRQASEGVGSEDARRMASWLGRQDTDRNLKLFWVSCRLAEGDLPMSDALDELVKVAQPDFGEREITRTVESAYRTVATGPTLTRTESGGRGGMFGEVDAQMPAPTGRGL